MPKERAHGVLIAEDEEDIRSLMAYMFESEDYKVFQVGDGSSALDTFRGHAEDISLLITDLSLPGLGGIKLIQKVRAMKPSTKIIGTSGYSRPNAREEVLNAGGDEFIPKPFDIEDVLRMSNQLLGRT